MPPPAARPAAGRLRHRPPPPPPAPATPAARALATPASAVHERVAAELRALGLVPQATPDGLTAEVGGSEVEGWADCPRIVVRDPSKPTRSGWAAPQARTGAVTAVLRPEGKDRTRVSVATRFAATYNNRFVSLPTSRPCASTGALEQRLLDAAEAAGGTV